MDGNKAIAKATGKAKIVAATVDGDLRDTIGFTVALSNFNQDIKPITSSKCAPCHIPPATFNWTDSAQLVRKGPVAMIKAFVAGYGRGPHAGGGRDVGGTDHPARIAGALGMAGAGFSAFGFHRGQGYRGEHGRYPGRADHLQSGQRFQSGFHLDRLGYGHRDRRGQALGRGGSGIHFHRRPTGRGRPPLQIQGYGGPAPCSRRMSYPSPPSGALPAMARTRCSIGRIPPP